MTSDPSINAPSDEPENGVLAETGAIDTSDLGLLTTNTAHVNVILPTEEDEDDDDVVDDDDISILFDSLLSGDTVTAQQEEVAAVVIDADDVAEQEYIEPEHLEQEPASDESTSDSDESTSVDIDDELDVVEAEIIDDEDEVAPVTADASDDDFADESEESETDLDDEPEGESDGEAEPANTSVDDEPVDHPDEEPEPEAVDVASTTAVAEDVSGEGSKDDELDEGDDELDEDEEAEDASAVSEDSDEIASDDESGEPSGSEASEDDAGDVAFDTEESEDGEFEDEGAEGEGSDGEESDEDESERAAAAEDEEPDADAADSEEFDRDAADEDAETSAPVAETETVDTHETVDAHETADVADLESDGVDADALLAEGETPAPETPAPETPAVENASAVEAPLIAAAAAAAITATQTDPAPAERKADEEPPVSETRDIHDLERVTVRTGAVETTPAPRRLGEVGEGASRETPDLLTADRLLDPHRKPKPEPEGAWQHFVYTVSGKRINLGDGKRARERKELTARIAAPIAGGSRFVPVLSRKGGVGKTTVTTLIGMALADARDDRVVAVDANPDRGTLAERISRSSTKTVRDLVRVRDEIRGYNDLSSIVSRDETRLDVLASDSDPRVAEAFSDIDYRHVADVASRYYSIVLTDTGTGIVHSVMGATLDLADQLVIVAGLSVDEARAASETLTWLETNGFSDIARGAIVVLNQTSAGAPVVRMNEVEEHFRTRVSEVVRIPYDPMIASGSAITFRDLQPETRVAARELAALVVNGLRGTSA